MPPLRRHADMDQRQSCGQHIENRHPLSGRCYENHRHVQGCRNLITRVKAVSHDDGAHALSGC